MWDLSRPDGRSTMSEWPVRVWSEEEFPARYAARALEWCEGDFAAYDFVYATKRKTSETSFDYLFGYGRDKFLFLRAADGEGWALELRREQITCVVTWRELLEAAVILRYREDGEEEERELCLPYVPSVYYLYDPFLNWVLGLEKDFTPALAERESPRPRQLYRESLAMFNYALNAYRLGPGFSEYAYDCTVYRSKWMPWKKTLEERLTVPMERGRFEAYHFKYVTRCVYHLERNREI